MKKRTKTELKVNENPVNSIAAGYNDNAIPEPKKFDYLEGLRGCGSKCFQCDTIMQQVSSLIDELQDIRRYETQGVCTHCNQSGLPVGCRRCYHLISKFLSSKVKEYESRQQQYKEWLTKVKHVLHGILAVKNFCNREHADKYITANKELERLLKQLQTPLTKTKRVLQIDNYSGKEFKVRQSQSQTDLLTESAIALEKVLDKLKKESERISNEKQKFGKSSEFSLPSEKGSLGSLPSLTTTYKVLPPISVKEAPSEYNKNSFVLLPPSSEMLDQNFKLKIAMDLKSTTVEKNVEKWGISHVQPHVGEAVGMVRKEAERKNYKNLEDRFHVSGISAKGTELKSALKNRRGEGLTKTMRGESKSKDKEKQNIKKLQIDQNMRKLESTSSTSLTSGKRKKLKTLAKEIETENEVRNKRPEEFKNDKVGKKNEDDVEKKSEIKEQEVMNEKMKENKVADAIKQKENKIKKEKVPGIEGKDTVVAAETSVTPSTTTNLPQKSVIIRAPLSKVSLLSMNVPSTKASTTSKILKDKVNEDEKKDLAAPKKQDLGKGHSKLLKGKNKIMKNKTEDDDDADSYNNGNNQDKENRSKNKPAKKGKNIKHSASTMLFMSLLKEKEKERALKEKLEKMNANAKPIAIPVLKKMSLPILAKGKTETNFTDEGSLDSSQTPQITAGGRRDFLCTYDKMIRGTGIVPFEPPITDEVDSLPKPLLFRRVQGVCPPPSQKTNTPTLEVNRSDMGYCNILYSQSTRNVLGDTKGIFKYELSNREYIDKGITKLPSMKIMRKITVAPSAKTYAYDLLLYLQMNIYKMVPAHVGKKNWFERHKKDNMMFYESGERLAVIDSDGHGRWYYRNGTLALDYYAAEEIYAGHRYVIYSFGGKDALGISRPVTVLASFDHIGNGVVYDDKGNVRLKYNQTEGVVEDVKIGPPGRWKWHSLNDPPVLLPVYVEHLLELEERDSEFEELINDTQHHIDESTKPTNDELLAVEFENYVKEKTTKLLQKYKPFHIRIKAFKLNKEFSLHVIDQANIYILFRDGHVSLKLNLGMLLDNKEILDTDASDVTHVMTSYDRQIPRSNSVAHIKRMIVDTKRKFVKQVSNSH